MSDFQVNPDDPLPRYYQVYNSLLERIRSGEFKPGDALPAERRLTQEYAVSRITIVKALDVLEQDGLISRQHGRGTFVTEPEAEAEPEAKTFSIAFLSGVFDHPYLFNVLMGIARCSTKQHCHLQVIGAYENSQEETRYIHEAIERGIDGLIVYPRPGYENIQLYRELQARKFPLVMVDRYYPKALTDRVVFGDEDAAYQLTTHLLSRGHKRLAVLTHHEVETTSVRDRLSGYRRALNDHGIAYDEELVWLDVYAKYDPLRDRLTENLLFADRLRERLEGDGPTGLLAINQDVADRLSVDLMSIQAERMRAVIENGMGEYEMSLELAAFTHNTRAELGAGLVGLGVHSGEQLGEKAADLLLGRLKGEVSGDPQSVVVPMRIQQS